MNLGTIRTMLRRRLQEVVADQWSNSDLDGVINVALGLVQTQVMKVHPDAFLEEDTHNAEANIQLYQWPVGFLTIMSVEYKDSGGDYRKIRPMPYDDTLNRTNQDVRYARRGKYLVISPTPGATVTAAIRIWYAPTLSITDDSDVPSVVVPLHIAIVLWAQLLLMGERSSTSAPTEALLTKILADIPTWYLTSGDEPPTLDIDLGKDQIYGYQS